MSWRAMANPAFLVACGVMAASAVGMGRAIEAHGYHLQKLPIHPPGNRQLSVLPAETSRWTRVGADRVEAAEVIEELDTTNYVSRLYRRKESAGEGSVALDFHAAYYTGMIDTVPHVPERCFVGGGLERSSFSRTLPLPLTTETWLPDPTVPEELAGSAGRIYTVRLPNNPDWTDAPGARVRLPRGVTPERPIEMRISEFISADGEKLYAGYFFIANGGTVPSASEVRTLAFDLTNDYAYYLKVQVTSGDVESMEELAAHAADLLDDLLGEIMRCVPDWTEVELGKYPEDRPRS